MSTRASGVGPDGDTLLVTCPALPEMTTFAGGIFASFDTIRDALEARFRDGGESAPPCAYIYVRQSSVNPPP